MHALKLLKDEVGEVGFPGSGSATARRVRYSDRDLPQCVNEHVSSHRSPPPRTVCAEQTVTVCSEYTVDRTREREQGHYGATSTSPRETEVRWARHPRHKHKGKSLSSRAPTHTSDDAIAARPLAPGPPPRVPRAPAARGRPAERRARAAGRPAPLSSATRRCRRPRCRRRRGRVSSTSSSRSGSTRSWRTGCGRGRRRAGRRRRSWNGSTGSFSSRPRGRCGPTGAANSIMLLRVVL